VPKGDIGCMYVYVETWCKKRLALLHANVGLFIAEGNRERKVVKKKVEEQKPDGIHARTEKRRGCEGERGIVKERERKKNKEREVERGRG